METWHGTGNTVMTARCKCEKYGENEQKQMENDIQAENDTARVSKKLNSNWRANGKQKKNKQAVTQARTMR